jgi:hypothetical protein
MQLTAHTFTSTSRHVPYLDKELTGCLIDSAWISFITRALTAPEILGQSDVVRELARIEKSQEFPELRCKFQRDIDHLIDSLLSLPPKQRLLVCLQTDLTLRALALDRVQVATFKLVETARPDRTTPVETVKPLIELFQRVLSGEPV